MARMGSTALAMGDACDLTAFLVREALSLTPMAQRGASGEVQVTTTSWQLLGAEELYFT
jgi:hypothetical protein